MSDYTKLENQIKIKFQNLDLYNNAFTHRSFVNENRTEKVENNERLEFLGDAVLELIATDFLYKNYPDPEGILTNWRSALVKKETLALISKELGLGAYLFLGKGEDNTGGREKDYILANTFEAFLGAIYLDCGYAVAEKFVKTYLLVKLEKILSEGSHIDAKSHFQEIAQEKENITPNYKLIKAEGPDHAKMFTMGAFLGEELIGLGTGNNKQSAEQIAAKDALDKKGWS